MSCQGGFPTAITVMHAHLFCCVRVLMCMHVCVDALACALAYAHVNI